ncbi:MAG: NAD(P)-binding domain-containing protein, partial [Deltaproteobacteria bacterium]|nr:NAD(P)-binding domain-containing protein [Deltaproteobacteria bacterium]
MDLKTSKIGIIGGGMMAENILRGMVRAQLISPDQVTVSDIHPDRLTYMRDSFKVPTSRDNVNTASKADLLILAVKPQTMKLLLGEIKSVLSEKQLVISIAAGVKTKTLSDALGGTARIVRTMPNVGARVLASATAICAGPGATQDDMTTAKQIFEAIGSA